MNWQCQKAYKSGCRTIGFSFLAEKMSRNQDLCLAVFALLTTAGISHGAPQMGRVVNGTDSSVEKYPFVVSWIKCRNVGGMKIMFILISFRFRCVDPVARIPAVAPLFPSSL